MQHFCRIDFSSDDSGDVAVLVLLEGRMQLLGVFLVVRTIEGIVAVLVLLEGRMQQWS